MMTRLSSANAPPQDLIQQALSVRLRAYAPYSRFLVGAALLDDSGRIHVGCNVENVSYGLTQCAERTAICSAVASEARSFQALVVASVGAVSPCGACRQVLAEFTSGMLVWLVDADDPQNVRSTTLAELLPQQFHFQPPTEGQHLI